MEIRKRARGDPRPESIGINGKYFKYIMMYKIIKAIKNPQLMSEVRKKHFAEFDDEEFRKILIRLNCINEERLPIEWATKLRFWDVEIKFTKGRRDKFAPKGFNLVIGEEGIAFLKKNVEKV